MRQFILCWQLMRCNRPVGMLLLMWPTIIALWVATTGFPSQRHMVIFIIGSIIMRALGCVANDMADCAIDAKVLRTKHRPLASGAMSTRLAWVVLGMLGIGALCLWLLLNREAQIWAIVALCLAVLYPFTKRFFACPQAVLGLAFSMGIVVVYAECNAAFFWYGAMLVLHNFVWTVMYDTQYALTDWVYDQHLPIFSAVGWLGCYVRTAIRAMQVVLLSSSVWLIWHTQCIAFVLAAGVTLGCFIYQDRVLNKGNDNAIAAFLVNQWIGCAWFVAVVMYYATR